MTLLKIVILTIRSMRCSCTTWVVSYQFNEMVTVNLNINNVFDEEPEASAIARGYDVQYDNTGRYIRAGHQGFTIRSPVLVQSPLCGPVSFKKPRPCPGFFCSGLSGAGPGFGIILM